MTAKRRRCLTGGAVFLSLAALVAGCGPLLPPATPTSDPSSSASPAAGLPTLTGTPQERLTAALSALSHGYTFETVLTVGGIEAGRVVGRWFDGSSELSITSSGATATYRIIPPNAWLQDATGAWVEADAATANGDPLTPLLAPSSVDPAAASAGTDAMVATYPATALGLQGTDPVKVAISITADGTITTHYETTVGTAAGVSETVLKPAPAQDSVSAPSLVPQPTP